MKSKSSNSIRGCHLNLPLMFRAGNIIEVSNKIDEKMTHHGKNSIPPD